MKTMLSFWVLIFCSHCVVSQEHVITIDEHRFQVDQGRNMILVQLDDIASYQDLNSFSEVKISLNGVNYLIENAPSTLDLETAYTVSKIGKNFKLYFTELPIIAINANVEILDEPKVLADFIYADEEQIVVSNIGIEIRGGVSQWYPKKTYDIELWEDNLGNETKKESFNGLRNDDDWILDGLYNEPLRIRSNIAHNLWLEMHEPYYQLSEPKAKAGAEVRFVELFINGSYRGLYNLSEQVDKKQLKLKDTDGGIKSELYKGEYWGGAVTFDELPGYDNNSEHWGGYQYRYPDEIAFQWQNVYDFTAFIMTAPTEEFTSSVWDRFHMKNNIDYFIFLNLTRATDNRGKNIYLAKYDLNEPYFYVPWDLDGVFGTNWTGGNDNITDDVISNGFYDRALRNNPNGYLDLMKARWWELRGDVLSNERLLSKISQSYNYLKANRIYEREALAYEDFDGNGIALIYMNIWLQSRLDFLDVYFEHIDSAVDDLHSLSRKFDVFPNPTIGEITIDNNSGLAVRQIYLLDFQGRLLSIQSENIGPRTRISLSSLSAGTYLLQIFTDVGAISQKVIKQ